ncbi:hypothetical protein D7V88_14280, partial [Corallococcus terminator]
VQTAPQARPWVETGFMSRAQVAGRDQAMRTIGLPPSTPQGAATTLRDERLGDGNSNCLERAMALARPGDSVVFLTDSRDGVGHAVVRRKDGSLVDPNEPKRTYPDLLAYQSSHPHYSQPLSVPREKLAAVLGTPVGPGRDALIQTLGLASVANRLVADTYDMRTLTTACGAVHAAVAANQNAGAGHIMAEAMRAAISSVRSSHPEWSAEQVMDYAVAATHASLVGPGHGLDQLNQLGARGNVVEMINALATDKSTFVGGGLDLTNGKDLRPELNDLSNNQAFHCFFFVTAGYVANGQPLLTDVLANGVGAWGHEVRDEGSSREDYIASNLSISMGQGLLERGLSGDMGQVADAPEVMLAVYTPEAGSGPGADRARRMATERIDTLKDALVTLENGKDLMVASDLVSTVLGRALDTLGLHDASYVLPIANPPDWVNPANQ